jgi:hypothetical protein
MQILLLLSQVVSCCSVLVVTIQNQSVCGFIKNDIKLLYYHLYPKIFGRSDLINHTKASTSLRIKTSIGSQGTTKKEIEISEHEKDPFYTHTHVMSDSPFYFMYFCIACIMLFPPLWCSEVERIRWWRRLRQWKWDVSLEDYYEQRR